MGGRLDFEVVPLVGVGPVRLGMTRDEARAAIGVAVTPFAKVPDAVWRTDAFHGAAFQVFYSGDRPIVDFIELSAGSGVEAVLSGLTVFATPADEVIAQVSARSPFDANDRELGFSYVFPQLELAFWRPVIPESPDDPDGRCFATVGIGAPGYFSRLG